MKWTPYRLPSLPTTNRTYKLSPRTVTTRGYAERQAAELYARAASREAYANRAERRNSTDVDLAGVRREVAHMRREADVWMGIVTDTDGAREEMEQLRFAL